MLIDGVCQKWEIDPERWAEMRERPGVENQSLVQSEMLRSSTGGRLTTWFFNCSYDGRVSRSGTQVKCGPCPRGFNIRRRVVGDHARWFWATHLARHRG